LKIRQIKGVKIGTFETTLAQFLPPPKKKKNFAQSGHPDFGPQISAAMSRTLRSGLPDGLFSNQNPQFG
jgi:hypothetical protein